jgi:tetratricopeptide (TPR) repeat protein
MPPTHYDILGVQKGCSAETIRQAYRKLVLIYHPDRTTESDALDTFLKITQAYEVLNDEDRRRHYDKTLDLDSAQAKSAGKKGHVNAHKRPARTGTASKSKDHASPRPSSRIANEVSRLALVYGRGQYVEAEKLALRILERDPRQAIPYAVLGDLARSRGEIKEASKMYAFAVQMDPGNALYQQRHEELLARNIDSVRRSRDEGWTSNLTTPMIGLAIVAMACIYIALSRETPLLPTVALVSTWTLGLVVMTFLCGVVVGASLSLGGLVDRFQSLATTSLGRVSPSIALGTIAIVNFWAATLLYILLGVSQRAFNYSTSRVVGAVAIVTFMLAIAAAISGHVNAFQVLLWGGNLAYMGALCGWMVADSLRR